ncbi:MAG: protoporphyrinogen oxidase [Microbacteriaceae bacterium]|nr:MAG: protoporphyrinogen oxidase [Microbacteriaceae bacterium]
MSEPLDRALAEPDTRIAVIGGGVAGLVAARECARPGFRVMVLESSDRLGGTVARTTLAGVPIDTGAESFATRGGHVAALLTELGLGDEIESPNPAGAWLQLPDRAVPLPGGSLLGVPGSPLARDVIAAIGWRGAVRAYLDRLMPVMKIGHEQNFGRLVRRRMGAAVLDKLVAPVTTGVYSADPDELEVGAAAPGLNQALTRTGSLSGAVTELRTAAKPDAGTASSMAGDKAGAAVAGLRGGIFRLIETLEADARARGAEVRTGVRVTAITRAADDADVATGVEPTDEIDVESTNAERDRAAPWQVELAEGEVLAADVVLLATPAAEALELLRGASAGAADAADLGGLAVLADLDWPHGTPVELATLVLDAPALDAAPRGSGMLVAAGANVRAKALTHTTAKWPWLAERAVQGAPGRHVVRLSYGRVGQGQDQGYPGQGAQTAELTDAEFRELALRDAAALLNIPLQASMLVGFARTRWVSALPHAVIGQRDRVAAVRSAVGAVDGLEVTGSWLAGTGLASVVPDAKEAAARIRGLRWRLLTEED